MFWFSCFFPPKENIKIDMRPTYDNNIDSVFTLNKRIENDNYEVTDFDKSYLEENKHFLEVSDNDEYYRNILFNKLCILIKYHLENKDIINNIDDFRYNLSLKLKGNMLPVFFQITNNLIKKDDLKDIIFNKMHYYNILLIDKLIIVNDMN